jgi:hypothetical protein
MPSSSPPACSPSPTAFAAAAECIPGYPDDNLPTVLLYRDGKCAHTLVGLRQFGGASTSPELVSGGGEAALCGARPPALSALQMAQLGAEGGGAASAGFGCRRGCQAARSSGLQQPDMAPPPHPAARWPSA